MNINLGKIAQITLVLLSFILLFYTYYYLPKQNKGSIKVETKEEIKTVEEIKSKNTFKILSISIRIKKGKNTQLKRKSLIYCKTSQT
jgi:hypothetical protein